MKAAVGLIGLVLAVVFVLGAVTTAFDIQALRAGLTGVSWDVIGVLPFLVLLLAGVVTAGLVAGTLIWVSKG